MTASWLTASAQLLESDLRREKVLTITRLTEILDKYGPRLGTPASLSGDRFVKTLAAAGTIMQVEIKPEVREKKDGRPPYKPFTRYIRSGATAAEIALSLRPNSYFSHGTAAYLHGLLDGPSDLIYVNKEQSPKFATPAELTQDAIDQAFSNLPRISQYVYIFAGKRMVLLNGKNTKNYQVIEGKDPSGLAIRLTSLERTLVDITVRPTYAGGVSKVLQAFCAASERVSVGKLVGVIKALGHIYPYHQAVGFYLAKSGFTKAQLRELVVLGLDFDFYLANRIKKKVLDTDWRVFIPADLESMSIAGKAFKGSSEVHHPRRTLKRTK
jgi:hypothetical protein